MKNKTKVLHIITTLEDGGAEAVLFRLCKNDKDLNHLVISLSGKGKYSSELEKIGIELFHLNFTKKSSIFFETYKLWRLIKKINPNIVQTWMYHADFLGGLLSKLAGVKKIFWGVHHSDLAKNKTKKLTIFIAKINCFLSFFIPTNIIYCAKKSFIVHKQFGFNNKMGIVIHNGYDVKEFYPLKTEKAQIRESLGLNKNIFHIGHVGRNDPQKDHDNLINALHILKEKKIIFKASLVGTGLDNNNKNLKELIEKKNLNNEILLLGRRSDIVRYMNCIDLFVLSSSNEAFPNVLNEAMACGTPCVSTDVGDSKHIVGSTGWIAPSKNSLFLANKIIQALEEKNNNLIEWTKRSDLCRKRIVEKFNINKMIENYRTVWND